MQFSVGVKSNPPEFARGTFQCRVGDEGLELNRRKKTLFVLPVGSPAEYLGSNKLRVECEGNELTLTVTKFGSYQNALAADLASYLRGEAAAPHAADYRLPWYCYVLSALPLGIPIITVGGAIPGAVGFGLAAGCMAIAQQD
ncbi:MAG: hypothetical protein KY476_09670, partial [Planctomycetes bacterium]|nr:hypothetical protein [Planctomycetota bacterium]